MSNRIRGGLLKALTWRYILVTVAALLIIEIVLIVLITQFAPPYTIGMQPDVYLMEKLKSQAVVYLKAGQRRELQQWLESIDQPVINLTIRDDWLRVNLSRFPQPETQMLLVFHEKEGVIASSPLNHPFSQIQRIEELPGPLDSSLFQSVPPRPGPDGVITRNGNSAISIYPIQQEDGALLALLILINLAPDVPPSLAELLTVAVTGLLIITAAVGLLGGIFGYLSSRFLVRHVRGLAEATASWGQGDFSLAVVQSDKIENELDALALHLDQLRPQIQESLSLRESIAVQGERQRIAQELHDSVKQQIFTLRMNLATLQTIQQDDAPAFQSYLQNAMSLAENAQQELSSIIQVFYQPVKEKISASERLRNLIAEWSRQTRIAVDDEIEANLSLPIELEHGLRRILQESLANVYKHSGAQRVRIGVKQSHGELHVSIEDDGCGFEVDTPQLGFGLLSMQERVRSVAGSIQIKSSPAGTALLIQIPLKGDPAPSSLNARAGN